MTSHSSEINTHHRAHHLRLTQSKENARTIESTNIRPYFIWFLLLTPPPGCFSCTLSPVTLLLHRSPANLLLYPPPAPFSCTPSPVPLLQHPFSWYPSPTPLLLYTSPGTLLQHPFSSTPSPAPITGAALTTDKNWCTDDAWDRCTQECTQECRKRQKPVEMGNIGFRF